MRGRIEILCTFLERADVFADVGCDHGYCTEYMLKNNLCRRALFSDISAGSLAKAEKLLAGYVREGRAEAYLGGGFFGQPRADEVLVAGIGGREIVAILSDERWGYLPEKFVFQPMHDAELLRRYLIGAGGYIQRDLTFRAGRKFYDVVKGRKRLPGEAAQDYSPAEYAFGRENLRARPEAFSQRTEKQLREIEGYLSAGTLGEESRAALNERKKKLEEAMRNADE